MTVRCACAQGEDGTLTPSSYLGEVDAAVELHGPAKKQRSNFTFAAMADSLDEMAVRLPDVVEEENIIDMEDGAGIAITERELYAHVMSIWQSCRDTATRTRLVKTYRLYCAGQM